MVATMQKTGSSPLPAHPAENLLSLHPYSRHVAPHWPDPHLETTRVGVLSTTKDKDQVRKRGGRAPITNQVTSCNSFFF